MLIDSRRQLTRNFRSKLLPGPSVDLFRDSFYAIKGLLGRISRAAPKLNFAEPPARLSTPKEKGDVLFFVGDGGSPKLI
jgi:hypothetical protein